MIPNITIVLLTMGRRCAGLIDYTGSNMARITHDTPPCGALHLSAWKGTCYKMLSGHGMRVARVHDAISEFEESRGLHGFSEEVGEVGIGGNIGDD